MKSPSEYLSLAKEKVASKRGKISWYLLCQCGIREVKDGFQEAAILALELQAEDAEKEREVMVERWNRVSDGQIKDIGTLAIENEQLKAELSQAREEKAKAFDEGCEAMKDKLNDEYRYDEPINPYNQDTQPKQ